MGLIEDFNQLSQQEKIQMFVGMWNSFTPEQKAVFANDASPSARRTMWQTQLDSVRADTDVSINRVQNKLNEAEQLISQWTLGKPEVKVPSKEDLNNVFKE
jgi:hypothetical protein